jgi:hypothetical protein
VVILTCFWNFSSQEDYQAFSESHIANNHVIPATTEQEALIESVEIGDVITISGQLVNYNVTADDGTNIGTRATSTTREDTGNGACEVIYVRDISILSSPRHYRQLIFNYSKLALIFTFAGLVASLFFPIHYHSKSKLHEKPLHPRIRKF